MGSTDFDHVGSVRISGAKNGFVISISLLRMGQRNPAPVEHCGKHPIIYRVSTIQVVQDFLTTHRTNLVILQTEN